MAGVGQCIMSGFSGSVQNYNSSLSEDIYQNEPKRLQRQKALTELVFGFAILVGALSTSKIGHFFFVFTDYMNF